MMPFRVSSPPLIIVAEINIETAQKDYWPAPVPSCFPSLRYAVEGPAIRLAGWKY